LVLSTIQEPSFFLEEFFNNFLTKWQNCQKKKKKKKKKQADGAQKKIKKTNFFFLIFFKKFLKKF
jgi:hypothetical protein